MNFLFLAGNCINRAVARTERAALAFFGVDCVLKEVLANARVAFFVDNVGIVLIAEIADC